MNSALCQQQMMPPNCDVRFIPDSGLSERNVNTHSRFGWPWNFESRPGWIIETQQWPFELSLGANRQTLRLRFVIKTMSAAVAHMPDNLLGLSTSFDRDHLNTHRHCLLAFKATDNLGEIDHFCDIGILVGIFPTSSRMAHLHADAIHHHGSRVALKGRCWSDRRRPRWALRQTVVSKEQPQVSHFQR